MLKSAIVADCGSYTTKAGLASTKHPNVVFPTVVARNKNSGEYFIGEEAYALKEQVTLKYPVMDGYFKDMDRFQNVLHCVYQQLGSNPKEHPLILTSVAETSRHTKEKLAEIMFETFEIPLMYLAIHQVLSLYSSGRTTGLVCDSGQVTRVVAVYEGHVMKDCLLRHGPGGSDLHDYLYKYLKREHPNLKCDSTTVYDIKEKLCYLALDSENEAQTLGEYKLPDGNLIKLGKERYLCPEIMFKPELHGMQTCGVHEVVCNTGMKSGDKTRPELFKNVLICGGNSLLNGFTQRMDREIRAIYDKGPIKLITAKDRKYSAWLGGSILASLPTLANICLKKEEYNDYGPSYVDTKFF